MEDRKKGIITVADVTELIEDAVPVSLQESWDNSGLLIGFPEKHVKKVITCLEITEAVADEAVAAGADMIVSHHPLIFSGIRKLSYDSSEDRAVMKLVSNGISVYSCHTPFDKVRGGNNDIIAERLGLSSVKNLRGDDVVSPSKMAENRDEADIGRTGRFRKPLTYMQAIELAANQLNMSIRQLRACGDLNTEITSVGICTGAGADMAEMAVDAGCQLFITGDVKYHEAQVAAARGICLLDAGHYGTEKFFAQAMRELLEKKLAGKAEVVESAVNIDPFNIL
mgnify:FL=1